MSDKVPKGLNEEVYAAIVELSEHASVMINTEFGLDKEEIKNELVDELVKIVQRKRNKKKYSDDETIEKVIELIAKGKLTEEEAKKKFNLTDDDMDVIDFVINEY